MKLYGLTIFLSAFLLFLVQPLLAKLILPRFGGSVAVWATCLVFFQAALLLGYAYAHQLSRRDSTAKIKYAHVVLLLASLAMLPIIPIRQWQLQTDVGPSIQILLILVATIGLPFTLLATTSPLLQAWLARGQTGRNPYRLFAVSNLASLAALVSYPWLIEPWLQTAIQAKVWSAAYAVYVVLVCLISIVRPSTDTAGAGGALTSHNYEGRTADSPSWSLSLSWIALAALGSYELVAITNHLTQNIPSFPMMWVLPLVIYLLTFSLCFDADRWYAPRTFRAAILLALLAMCWVLYDKGLAKVVAWQMSTFLVGLFIVCMYCHGELAMSRPSAARLTHFYLCVSAGGVFGGAVVGLAAPAVLPGYFEVEIGLVIVAIAVLLRSWGRNRYWSAASVLVVLCAAATALYRVNDTVNEVVAMSRNFYGVLRIQEYGSKDTPDTFERTLTHGSIMHGEQFLSDARRHQPTSYYTETSGIGRLLKALGDRQLEVGVVGLGTGTIAAYGKRGDNYCFYEIDAAMVTAANKYFTFLADSAATVRIVVGDGRLLLRDQQKHRLDVLAVDAFSGDSIPIHLLTREAFMLYRDRVKPNGVIAVHVSNRYLDLRPVVGQIAADLGLQVAYIEDLESDTDDSKSASDWILLATDRAILDLPSIREGTSDLPTVKPGQAWTDDYSNIVQVMSFTKMGDSD